MKWFTLLLLVLLVGCGRLKNEEVVRQCKVCDEAGLYSEIHYSILGFYVVSVTCDNKRYKVDKYMERTSTQIGASK